MSVRGKTTPASTPGSFSPATGRPSRTQPDTDGGAEPFTDGYQLIDLQARVNIGRLITTNQPEITGFTLVRDPAGVVTGVDAHTDGNPVPVSPETNAAVIAYCAKHPDATSTVNTDYIPSSINSASRNGLSGVPHNDDPRVGFVADQFGTPRLAILDEKMANWALGHAIARRFQSHACDGLVQLYPTWSPTAIADCFDHPITPDQWAATPEGTIIRHPTSLWKVNQTDPADGDVIFRGYNPDTGQLSYSERGLTGINTVEPDSAALFRFHRTTETS